MQSPRQKNQPPRPQPFQQPPHIGVSRRRSLLRGVVAGWAVGLCGLGAHGLGRAQGQSGASGLKVAAASDLRGLFDALLAPFQRANPGLRVDVVYGSSGKLSTQLRSGAPFDVFFSADRAYAQGLFDAGLCTAPPTVYAQGRLALVSHDAGWVKLPLQTLVQEARLQRFAIANPAHAPYGQRAQEALQSQGVWQALQGRLVLGDNVAQALQFVHSGAAQAGVVALSLSLSMAQGVGEREASTARPLAWAALPRAWHTPLDQSWVVLKRANASAQAAALAFAALLQAPAGLAALRQHGFDVAKPAPA